ncbi:MAG: lamin tail domain-containing protein, partial [Flavobacteriales bacterium]|nr:lamin tail domain-containing protein [Flavobacteriales bacterium]
VDQTFTITDDTDPTVSLTAPADTTVYLDATCFAAEVVYPVSGDASGFIVDATDLCDTDVAHTITHADDTTYTGAVDGVGSYSIFRTYTVMVMDDCGNSSSASTSHTIAVLDTLNPSITPDFPNDTIIYADDSNGYFDPTPSSTGGPSVAYSDNCSGAGESQYGAIGQSVPTGGLIITAIGDPNDAASTCRFVEIHNSSDGDIDMSGYALQRWTNGNSGPSTSSNIDLSSIGTLAPGAYAHIANNAGFSGCYGFAPTIVANSGGPADSNGDDNIAIIDGGSNIIDLFGVPGEAGDNNCHDFEDGVALRAGTNTDPNGGAWDEAGWIVYSDFSNASGCTNHNSSQQQNAADIAPLLNNWAGAGPAPVQTDFNDTDISFSDVTTSYTASACYTFERTWTVTVTDNNGNSTTNTSMQTIQVADTSAPEIAAAPDATAACDFFGFDLSAGDESTLLAGTSFEQASTGSQYTDTGDAGEDHALVNNPGQADVNFTAANGEMGFTSYFYTTGSGGLSNDYTGVSSFTGTVDAFTDGAQGFQMTDIDGRMEVTFDEVDVSDGGVTLSIDAFVQSTGWESADLVRIWVVADGGEVDLLNTAGQDIDNLGIEDQWITYTLDLDGYDSAELHVSLASNSGSETLYIDNISFSQGSSPLATLLTNGYVSFSDNVELATTGASITFDAAPCEGAYDVVYTATDSCGNLTTSNQRIVLIDTVAPGLAVTEPADTVLFADADCNADFISGVPYPTASSSDNCDADAAITSYHVDSPKQYACLPSTGAFTLLRTYTFTATDNCGNTTTEQVNRLVTVLDTISPTFNVTGPADDTVNIDPFCSASTNPTITGMPVVTDENDNCDSNVEMIITHVDSAPVYTCSDADGNAEGSYTFVRTFTVTGTDDCGNATSVTLMQNITALDVTAPTILSLPVMATDAYTLDGDCMADLTPITMPMPTTTDACDTEVGVTSTYTDGAPTYSCSDADGEAEGSYIFTRTWTVTAQDDCGNMTQQQATQTIVVTDATAPAITATWPEDYSTDLDVDCMADLSPAAAGSATGSADDACDSESDVEVSYANGDTTYFAVNADDMAQGGFSFIRTWTVTSTDDCDNVSTETHDQTITANDVTAPVVTLETLPTYTVEGCYGDVDLSPAAAGTPTASAEDGCDSDVDVELVYTTDNLAFNEVVGDYSLVIDTISGPEEGLMGMTTVRMYIQTENADDFISAVAGDAVNPTGIRTTTSFYQNALGGSTANNYNALLEAVDPLVAYDSWVTIGIDEAPDGGAGEIATSVVGDWEGSFENGGDLFINDFFGGSWFTTYPNVAAVAGPDNRVLIGQFTTDGQMSGQLFVQVFPNSVGTDEMRLSFTFGDCAEDDDLQEGSYAFTRRWSATGTDDADNLDSAVTYQHIMVLDTEAPQLTNTCDIENGETVTNDCPGIGVMDFDPVPVPCAVEAIDNCDTDVNITLFTETEGYIPTDAIRNYCAPVTPEAQSGSQTCDDRAPESLRLFNFPGADDSFIMSSESENLVQVMADGSLSIAMEVENADGTGGFVLSAAYGAGQDWAAWEASGSNYKKDCAEIYPGEAVWEDWFYFLMTEGSLEGTGMYAGSSFELSHQPANGYYGLQMGQGANNKNANYGGSAWFFWQGNLVMNGTDMGPMASSGDMYMDLDCCLEWQVDYSYTALDDCGNPTGFYYSEAMGSDVNGGGADVSGGHTVGPVDITSIGGIKEPIRITGLSPNPTNNQSQLTFLVNENLRLRVDLYNSNGLLIQELYDGNAVTGVQYTMDIDVDNLSAGMYQVRISSATYIAVKKLLVAE